VDVLNALLRKVTIRRVDREGSDTTETILQLRAKPTGKGLPRFERQFWLPPQLQGLPVARKRIGLEHRRYSKWSGWHAGQKEQPTQEILGSGVICK
jgi:hypothetical protein